jgi:hypothetical protein
MKYLWLLSLITYDSKEADHANILKKHAFPETESCRKYNRRQYDGEEYFVRK